MDKIKLEVKIHNSSETPTTINETVEVTEMNQIFWLFRKPLKTENKKEIKLCNSKGTQQVTVHNHCLR